MRLIDADALIEVLNDNGVSYNADVNYFVTNAPTINAVSVVHGEWRPIIEENEFGEVYQTGIYCSECGEVLVWKANYCPNCGADMREREGEPQMDELQFAKQCHKPSSLYYRCYCDERKEDEYCNGCRFWYES